MTIMDKLRALRKTPPRLLLAVFKGALAFIILDILVLSSRVRSGFHYPITLTSATVVAIAGFPGANYGQVIAACVFAFTGIGLGAVAFVILAKLGSSQVAQGIVFTLVIYLFSVLKAMSMKFFGLALLGILISFAGLYTSLILPGHPFSPHYLEDYLKSYALAGAIVIAVNFLILPISSETELRRTLVTSLSHIKTFSHLLAKSYTLTITEEEISVRQGLAQSIRADFGILQQKLGTTGLEVNWSKLGMEDYRQMIDLTHRLQEDLIGMHSTIIAAEASKKAGGDTTLFRTAFLPSTKASFLVLRRELSVTIREICAVLGEGMRVDELPEYEDFRGSGEEEDAETGVDKNGAVRTRPGRSDSYMGYGQARRPGHEEMVRNPLERGLRRQLDKEIGVAPTPVRGRSPAVTRRTSMTTLNEVPSGGKGEPDTAAAADAAPASPLSPSTTVGPTRSTAPSSHGEAQMQELSRRLTISPLLAAHLKFRESQQDVLAELLVSGQMGASNDELFLDSPQPAWSHAFSAEKERKRKQQVEDYNQKSGRLGAEAPEPSEKVGLGGAEDAAATLSRRKGKEGALPDVDDKSTSEAGEARLLLTMTSIMWLNGEFVKDLHALHQLVVRDIGKRTRSRLHFHVAEKPPKPVTSTGLEAPLVAGSSAPTKKSPAAPMPMYKALALLEGRTPVQPKGENFATRLLKVETLLRSDISLTALKTAAAGITFTTLLLAPSSRAFFTSYGLTGGVLSVVVAMSPSMGQTLFTFINQIIGTVSGSIYGMVLCYILRDVGGYRYNPYGIVCLLIPFALAMSWIIYTKPAMFALGLLALNAANVIIFTMVIYADVPTFVDSPALRAGKSIVSMCIALAIAFAFQYLLLRAPAKRLLRESLARLLSSISAYYILHTAYVSALSAEAETMTGSPAPREAIEAVAAELSRRERAIQAQLIDMGPLIAFAKLEPEFAGPFRGDLYKKCMNGSQLLMDRLREARVIVSTFDEGRNQDSTFAGTIPHFEPMGAYRRFHTRLMKHRFYVLTTALHSKTPLPQDSLRTRFAPVEVVRHDILVLTSRLVKQPNGEEAIRSTAFLRILSYMLAVANWRTHIDTIEEAVGGLLGVLEDDELL